MYAKSTRPSANLENTFLSKGLSNKKLYTLEVKIRFYATLESTVMLCITIQRNVM